MNRLGTDIAENAKGDPRNEGDCVCVYSGSAEATWHQAGSWEMLRKAAIRIEMNTQERVVHRVIEPKILYFGTPVVLISTLNENGAPNLAPMSSAWWLGESCMLGMGKRSQTVRNLIRERECVLNLPSEDLVAAVDRLALTTGRNPVPEGKAKIGYRYEPNKFGIARLSEVPSDRVKPPRVAECPVQLEAVIEHIYDICAYETSPEPSTTAAIEARIVRVHIDEELLIPGTRNYIDAEKWRPLIMSFCEFFGLGSGILQPSRLEPAFYGAPKRG